MVKVVLKKGKEQSLLRFHPWIFSGAIMRIDGSPKEGEIVEVTDCEGNFMAIGHYQIGSITIRILSFTPCVIDQQFYSNRIKEAYNLRLSIGLANSELTNAYRLIHGEGDGLPGLIIDFYNGTAVVQMHSVGMYMDRQLIEHALIETLGSNLKSIYKIGRAHV